MMKLKRRAVGRLLFRVLKQDSFYSHTIALGIFNNMGVIFHELAKYQQSTLQQGWEVLVPQKVGTKKQARAKKQRIVCIY